MPRRAMQSRNTLALHSFLPAFPPKRVWPADRLRAVLLKQGQGIFALNAESAAARAAQRGGGKAGVDAKRLFIAVLPCRTDGCNYTRVSRAGQGFSTCFKTVPTAHGGVVHGRFKWSRDTAEIWLTISHRGWLSDGDTPNRVLLSDHFG